MEFANMVQTVRNAFPDRIITIDSHIAGEPARLIVGGVGPIPGETMQEKRAFFMEHHDAIRLLLTREPRGHRDMFAACITEPVSAGARFGLIYMDARRYPYLCGHATMGAVMTLIEAGVIEADGDALQVIVDTPSGPMQTTAYMQNGKVESVAIQMVPSFVYSDNETLSIPDFGRLQVATVCVGGFFVMVSADQIGLDFSPSNGPRFIELGMQLIQAANQQLTVRHPARPEVNTVDVTEFYDPSMDAEGKGKSIVVLGEGHMDRSPCGTGTTAKMTLLHHGGHLGLNETFVNTSPLGTTFEGRLVEEIRLEDKQAVVAEVRGSAQITGVHEFIIDSRDPFQKGFLL
ncbi:MAG: proline racemase family protein [Desulfobacterales bacterium]|jgi:proline racemase